MIDSRDNQTYKTVTIGTQTWMAENLNYAYNEGSAKSYCYNDEESYCDIYGRLYLWSAAMDSAAIFSTNGAGCGYGKECSPSGSVRGVCPEGWHLPNAKEWRTLIDAVGGENVAGIKLKSTSGWANSASGGNDEYGFAFLPAGGRNSRGDFNREGEDVNFWSSAESDSLFANFWAFTYYEPFGRWLANRKNLAFSVRCLRD